MGGSPALRSFTADRAAQSNVCRSNGSSAGRTNVIYDRKVAKASLARRNMFCESPAAYRSDHPGRILVEDAELFLRGFRHVGHVDEPSHERGPRLLGDRLKRREIPELPLPHVDLGHLMIEHPVSQHDESAALRVDEHFIRQRLWHGTASLMSARAERRATVAVARSVAA